MLRRRSQRRLTASHSDGAGATIDTTTATSKVAKTREWRRTRDLGDVLARGCDRGSLVAAMIIRPYLCQHRPALTPHGRIAAVQHLARQVRRSPTLGCRLDLRDESKK